MSDNINEKNTNKDNFAKLHEDIAIIGACVKLPMSNNLEEFWDNVKNRRNCVAKFPESRRTDTNNYLNLLNENVNEDEYNMGGFLDEIDKFDNEFFKISPKEANLMDPNHRLFLQTAWGVIEDAGYGGSKLEGKKTGVYLAFRNIAGRDYSRLIQLVDSSSIVMAIPGNTSSIIPSRISYLLDLKGPSIAIDTACSSSLVALHLACQGIRQGDCDHAIVGGVEINLLPYKESISTMVGLNSSDFKIKTFDNEADGICESEGVGAILIKPLQKALKDGDNIYAVIKGSAINQDGRSVGITAPNASAQEEVIVSAWENAGIEPETISYIEAHGTATKIGDPTEILGIKKAFRRYTDRNQFCAVSSVKTSIGHTGSMAGLAGVINAVMALKNRKLPPIVNFSNPNYRISFHKSPVYVSNYLEDWKTEGFPRRCGVSAFGFSGTNCHVVLEEAPQPEKDEKKECYESFYQVLTMSAKSKYSLVKLINAYAKSDLKLADSMRDICYTANTGRGHYTNRLAILFHNREELIEKINQINNTELDNVNLEGVFYAEHSIIKGVNIVSDKGSITEGMKRTLNNEAFEKIEILNNSGQTDKMLVKQICSLYVKGADIDWNALYVGEKRRKVSLPIYQFERKRCWLDTSVVLGKTFKTVERDIFYTSSWLNVELDKLAKPIGNDIVLFFNDRGTYGKELADVMRRKGKRIIEVNIGEKYKKIDENNYHIQGCESDYKKLVQDTHDLEITQIVHLITLNENNHVEDIKQLEEMQQKGAFSLFFIVKAIQNKIIKHDIDIVLISKNVNRISSSEKELTPENATLFGLGKVVNYENLKLKCRTIDIDEFTDIKHVVEELMRDNREYSVGYREGKRYVEIITKADTSNRDENEISFKENGVYVLTGGVGGIGIEISKFIASRKRVKLVLISRKQLPERKTWDDILKSNSDKKLCRIISAINEIESLGSTVLYYSANVSEFNEMKQVFKFIIKDVGPINGIMHISGVSGGNLIKNQDAEEYKELMKAKVQGTWIIDKLTSEYNLDFMILFSSIITIMGGVGGGAYTAANAYLDAYSSYRNLNGKKTIAINWPTWNNIGFSEGVTKKEDREMFKSLTPDAAIKAFERVLKKSIDRVIIGDINFNSRVFNLEDYLPFKLSEDIKNDYTNNQKVEKSKAKERNTYAEVILEGNNNKPYTETERQIANIWGEVLGYKKLNLHDNFFELGGDSIIAVRMEVEMEKNNIPIKLSDISMLPTIQEMAASIEQKQGANSGNRKVIDNIEPFNDIFFQSCFYNSLFPVLLHFNKSITPFLTNSLAVYTSNEAEGDVTLGISYQEAKSLEDICNNIGIEVISYVSRENIVEDIISAINKDMPVIVWVDCYYESIRTDTYLKEHWPHTWLIYGYDEDKRLFQIIEHPHKQSLKFEKKDISFSDTIKCYEGYLENLKSVSDYATYFQFNLQSNGNQKVDIDGLADTMIKNIADGMQAIEQGLVHLKHFTENFREIVSHRDLLDKNVDKLIDVFNSIYNTSKVEMQKLQSLFSNQRQLIDTKNSVISNSDYVRLKLARYLYSSKYDIDIMTILIKKVDEIYAEEKAYYEKLCTIGKIKL